MYILDLDNASEWTQFTEEKLKPQLEEAIQRYMPVKEIHDNNEVVLKDVENILDNLVANDLDKAYKGATENADDASKSIGEVDYAINTTFVEVD